MFRYTLLLMSCSWIATRASSAEIGFKFKGIVASSPASVFGRGPFPQFTPISGRFVYDTNSPATHALSEPDSKGYRQRIYNGFSITIEGVSFRSDDYAVLIYNNLARSKGADLFSILWSDALAPSLEKPLDVQGEGHAAGLMNLTLQDSSGSAFSNSLLPVDLPINLLNRRSAVVDDLPAITTNDLVLQVVEISRLRAVTGDYDLDEDVDGGDFLIWQSTIGSSSNLQADGDHDGAVTENDLIPWRLYFGSGNLSLAPVPEPSIAALSLQMSMATAYVVLVLRRGANFRLIGVRRRCQRRRGFTLVELIVVTAVIAFLVAMLFPALQSTREAARRCACQNNLRQVGLALLKYEQRHHELPEGASAQSHSSASSYGISWWVRLLSDLEQSQLAQEFDFDGVGAGMVLEHPRNGSVIDGVQLQFMRCQSSAIPSLWPVAGYQVMMPSYVGIAGATNDAVFSDFRHGPCCKPRVDGDVSAGGALVNNRAVTVREILDGTSHTFIVGEASDFVSDSRSDQHRIDGGFPYGWTLGTKELSVPSNSNRVPRLPSWNITTISYELNVKEYAIAGVFNNHGPNNPLVSPHPSVVGLLYADASVRYLHDSSALSALKQLATRDDGR